MAKSFTMLELKHNMKYFSTKLDKKQQLLRDLIELWKLSCGNISTPKEHIYGLMFLDQLVYNYDNTKHSTK